MTSQTKYSVGNKILMRDRAQSKAERELAMYDRRGVVTGISNGWATVKTAMGNRVQVPANGIITNSDVLGKRVLVTRPAMGRAFVDAEVRG